MTRNRWIFLCSALLLAVIAAWLWWVRPKAVDMAAYAPSDSLLFLETNHPIEVVEALAGTEAWRAFETIIGPRASALGSHSLQGFMRWTGIGPIKSVILARAQVAVVVTDLRAAEEGDNLNINAEGALLIETHTSESRIKPSVEEALKTLAEKTYGRPTARRVIGDGVEYIEWIAPDGSRQIVGAVVGSLVVIGTSEHAVQDCLAVAQGRRPSLKDDQELHAMRLRLEREHALTFGYVPPGNSARLLAVGLPALLGRAPGDSEFQRLITNGAAKVFGSLGWTSNTYLGGIEDRYLITLQPSVVARLKPTFGSNNIKSHIQRVVPADAYSVTSYRFANPGAAWLSLKTAVSSQVDALSAIVFSSLLKSALLSYGIEDPESFLGAVDGELLTLRLDENSERSLLIAGVRERAPLRKIVTKNMSPSTRNSGATQTEILEDPQGEFAAGLSDEFIVIGSPPDVRRYYETRTAVSTAMTTANFSRLTSFVSSPDSSNVVTYTNDADRVRSFFLAAIAAGGKPAVASESFEAAIATLPYSVTETTIGERGIERTTRSPLGQFSSLLPLLFPQLPGAVKDANQPR